MARCRLCRTEATGSTGDYVGAFPVCDRCAGRIAQARAECSACGQLGARPRHGERWYCDTCYQSPAHVCPLCGELTYRLDRAGRYERTYLGAGICPNCCNSRTIDYCAGCGALAVDNGADFDDMCTCERCPHCERREDSCNCQYCEDCEEYECVCERCDDCGERIAHCHCKARFMRLALVGSPCAQMPFDRLVGVEMECYGRGLGADIEGAEYHGDGSVSGPHGEYGGEYVLFPASGDALCRRVAEVTDRMLTLGLKVNKTCGLHVHIDSRDKRLEDVERIAQSFAGVEDIFYDMVAASRRDNSYCRGDSLSQSNGRYHALNWRSAFRKYQTVEFRLHHGTLDAEKILQWIALCLFVYKLGEERKQIIGGMKRARLQAFWREAQMPFRLRKVCVKRAKQYSAPLGAGKRKRIERVWPKDSVRTIGAPSAWSPIIMREDAENV